jgi:hypothetical protein
MSVSLSRGVAGVCLRTGPWASKCPRTEAGADTDDSPLLEVSAAPTVWLRMIPPDLSDADKVPSNPDSDSDSNPTPIRGVSNFTFPVESVFPVSMVDVPGSIHDLRLCSGVVGVANLIRRELLAEGLSAVSAGARKV